MKFMFKLWIKTAKFKMKEQHVSVSFHFDFSDVSLTFFLSSPASITALSISQHLTLQIKSECWYILNFDIAHTYTTSEVIY